MTGIDGEDEGEMRRDMAKEEDCSFLVTASVCCCHFKHSSKIRPRYLYVDVVARTMSQRRRGGKEGWVVVRYGAWNVRKLHLS
jgi:hypothetical protein